jgi:hypothetical protein
VTTSNASNNVWAVGHDTIPGKTQVQTLNWNGTTWATVASPNATAGSSLLVSAATAPGATIVQAVGYSGAHGELTRSPCRTATHTERTCPCWPARIAAARAAHPQSTWWAGRTPVIAARPRASRGKGSGGVCAQVPPGRAGAIEEHRRGACQQRGCGRDQGDLPAGHAADHDGVDGYHSRPGRGGFLLLPGTMTLRYRETGTRERSPDPASKPSRPAAAAVSAHAAETRTQLPDCLNLLVKPGALLGELPAADTLRCPSPHNRAPASREPGEAHRSTCVHVGLGGFKRPRLTASQARALHHPGRPEEPPHELERTEMRDLLRVSPWLRT